MKYHQPYGDRSDTNAPYINGNPSTGTMGSIPPAASSEFPQREIVNFETDSTRVPDDADLHQLSKAVQWGKVNYSQDQGTANFIAITPTPAIAAYQIGQHFRIKMAHDNTGPDRTQHQQCRLFTRRADGGDQSELGAGDLFANQIIEVTFDGTSWQV